MTRLSALTIWLLCLIGGLYAAVSQLASILFGSGVRAHRIAVGWDQLFNAAAGGWPDETISSRMYRTENARMTNLIDWLFGDAEHCRNAYFAERRRAQCPPEMRT